MENNKNHLKDNMKISYVIKLILEELNKLNGEVPNFKWLENKFSGLKLKQDEFEKILRIMLDGGLIKDIPIRMVNIENMKITLKGIEYLLKYGD